MEMTHPHTIHKNHTTNLDTLAGNRGNLASGARNTNKRTVSDSRFEVGLTISGFNAGSSREYNTRAAGNTCWPIFCGFSSYPALSSCPESNEEASANKITALEKRSKRKGTTVFLHPFFGVSVVYPPINPSPNLDTLAGNRDNLASGARNTTNKRFPTPVVKSVSLFQALMPGVAGNKRPVPGNTCWPTCCGFSSYPVLFSYPGSMKNASAKLNLSALEKRSNKKGTQVFLHPFFGVPVVYPLTTVTAGAITVEGVAA